MTIDSLKYNITSSEVLGKSPTPNAEKYLVKFF